MGLDISWAAAAFALLSLVLLLAGLLRFGRGERRAAFIDPKFIWVCSVCTYNFVKTREESISVCPRCGSYNKK